MRCGGPGAHHDVDRTFRQRRMDTVSPSLRPSIKQATLGITTPHFFWYMTSIYRASGSKSEVVGRLHVRGAVLCFPLSQDHERATSLSGSVLGHRSFISQRLTAVHFAPSCKVSR